jgi:hypothetical protein
MREPLHLVYGALQSGQRFDSDSALKRFAF